MAPPINCPTRPPAFAAPFTAAEVDSEIASTLCICVPFTVPARAPELALPSILKLTSLRFEISPPEAAAKRPASEAQLLTLTSETEKLLPL